MPSFNRVIIAGHLGGDPETKDGGPTKFSVAVNDRWKDGNGDKQERTNWLHVVCWNGIAESAQKLHKGAAVLVEGSLRENTWIDEETQKNRSRIEIVASSLVFLSPKPSEQGTLPVTTSRKRK